MELFERMQVKLIKPDVKTYANISVCEKGGKWEKGLELFQEMKSKFVYPYVAPHNATISACEKGGKWAKALDLLQRDEKQVCGSQRRYVQRHN